MADPMINNNSANLIVDEAYKQFTGISSLDTITLADIIETGSLYSDISGAREQFCKALVGQCVKNWFTDESYRSEYKDPFFEDERRFGNIIQSISMQAPTVQESHAWRSFVSGTSTAGSYTLYLPIVETQYYGKTMSYELPITITDEQMDDAFRSEEEMKAFIDFIFLCVDNAIIQHREDMNMLNLSNFIGEKIAYASSVGAEGVHVVNLIQRYHDERGGNIDTVEKFRASADAMRYAAKTIDLFTGYLRKQSALYNTKGQVKFVPKDKLVVLLNSAFESDIEEVALSSTFHDNMVALPGYQTVPYWQSLAGDGSTINPTDFDSATSIDIVTSENNTVNQSGIVAFIGHKWCVMHTIRRERVAVQRFDPEACTEYFYQFRDQYMNNLALPSVVFTLEDITI